MNSELPLKGIAFSCAMGMMLAQSATIIPAASAAPSTRVTIQGRASKAQRVYLHIPAGTTMTALLTTSVSSDTATVGDYVRAKLGQPLYLGHGVIPAGTVLEGHVSDVEPPHTLFGGPKSRLGLRFDRMRIPGGPSVPISACVIRGTEQKRGIMKSRLGRTLVFGALGAGTGAVLGTAVGAIAGSAGAGAWSGTAIGGGIGGGHGLITSRSRKIVLKSGHTVLVKMEQPASIALRSSTGLI